MLRRLVAMVVGITALAIILGTAGVPSVLAVSQSRGMLTFESGVDQAVIGATIPGVTFSNTAGNPWLYGDVRTGSYNATYPNNCPPFGGPCAYAVNGNMFAWMGPVQGAGRIDFTSGDAQYFSALFSTADALTVEAYDSANKLIATQQVAPNVRTGRLDQVQLTGGLISYVLIKGAQNRWLMDDLTTDAPNVPNQQLEESNPALITVVQRVESPALIAPGSQVTFTVVATNRGGGPAKEATITLPLDTTALRVDEASFSRTGAWVSAITDTALTMQTGPMPFGGDVVTGTLRLTVLNTAAAGTVFGAPLTFTWRDDVAGGSGKSNNLLGLSVGGRAFTPTLAAAVADGKVTTSSAIFAPDEPVGLWYNTPDGGAVALSTIRANADGAISYSFSVSTLPAGAYSVVAYGHWTGFTAAAPFTLP